jgi:uncharacterized protein YodC (DUF2158 family)
MPFKEGEIVVLKSGGPKMTIKTIYSELEIKCTWFDTLGHAQEHVFPAILLRKAS